MPLLALAPFCHSARSCLGMCFVAVATSAFVLLRHRELRERRRRQGAFAEVRASTETLGVVRSVDETETPPLGGLFRTRVGGMAASRLVKMLEDLTQACHWGDEDERSSRTIASPPVPALEKPDDATFCQTWDEQVLAERRTLEAASEIVREVRRSVVHRKLPHFHAADRQLHNIEQQLEMLSMSTQSFWRYGRDAPMAELLELPLLQLAATGGEGTLVPVTLGFMKHTVDKGLEAPVSEAAVDDSPGEDAALLGVALGASRDTIESAYRRRSRHFHQHGRCMNAVGFHALTAARNRCLARIAAPTLRAYGGGGDLLAHYLLIGTDPNESRYRECSHGILDVLRRGELLEKIHVLQWPAWDIPLTWGDEDDMICFGGPNHMGASG
mmetsp:Transcript_38349/g.105640  ORF Transcript_38349/g.105640 Transcript_38349/m.105640 type:complete len:385 (-) Transcript_38349:3-1157(-)